jgi:predicted nucleic acid-binding protein
MDAAWGFEDRYHLSWWDALIVAAAQADGCTHLLSEDLQDGQQLDGVVVISPFLHTPASILNG